MKGHFGKFLGVEILRLAQMIVSLRVFGIDAGDVYLEAYFGLLGLLFNEIELAVVGLENTLGPTGQVS